MSSSAACFAVGMVDRVADQGIETVVWNPTLVSGVFPPPHAESAIGEAVAQAFGAVDPH